MVDRGLISGQDRPTAKRSAIGVSSSATEVTVLKVVSRHSMRSTLKKPHCSINCHDCRSIGQYLVPLTGNGEVSI